MASDQKRAWREYFDNDYITGDVLPEEGRTFTISDKSRDEVEGKEGKEHKLALTFTDGNRWLVNITNATYMAHMFGSPYPADWMGKRVTLQFDPTIMFGKDRVGGIRVIGSPDITEPVTFSFQENSRKRPRQVTMVPTQQAAGDAQEPISAPPTPSEATDAEPSIFDADDEEPPGRGPSNVTPLKPEPVDAKQLAEIKKLQKASGLYEAEFVALLDSYGASEASGLSFENAQYVIEALRERVQ